MPTLESMNDTATLRQTALLLEKTVIRQQKEIAKLRAENARLRGESFTQLELDLLKEQLEALKRQVFTPSSEKRPREHEKVETSPAPRRGHGPRPQPSLPIQVVTHTLEEDQRQCQACGGQMVSMGEQCEESEEITVVQADYKVVRHRRQKYRCQCNGAVTTAPGPAKLVPGGRYSPEFAVHVAEAKYLDHMPLERQVRAMGRRGLEVDSQTLWDQLTALASHLVPSYEAICRRVLEADVVLADETYWPLADGKETSRWWTWCVASEEIAAYRILKSRSANAARQVLGSFSGIVMTDGYGAYQSLARAGPSLKLAHCWAHVRRKFIEADDGYREQAEPFIELIGELFGIEDRVPRLRGDASPEERSDARELRQKLRQEHSRDVVAKLRDLAFELKPAVLPRSSLGKAIEYMLKLWQGLTAFLDDPRIPLSNNGAERALRGVVVGRKNHYGSRSRLGTEVAALFYTLFETAKLAGVDPHRYVLEAAKRAIAEPGTITLPADIT